MRSQQLSLCSHTVLRYKDITDIFSKSLCGFCAMDHLDSNHMTLVGAWPWWAEWMFLWVLHNALTANDFLPHSAHHKGDLLPSAANFPVKDIGSGFS